MRKCPALVINGRIADGPVKNESSRRPSMGSSAGASARRRQRGTVVVFSIPAQWLARDVLRFASDFMRRAPSRFPNSAVRQFRGNRHNRHTFAPWSGPTA
jgi:hypothetical protein